VCERPTLDIHVTGPYDFPLKYSALVDSGAHRTIFVRGVADAIGIRIGNAGARKAAVALMGANREVQIENVRLEIDGWSEEGWEAEVGFIIDPLFTMPFSGVLGSVGFFTKWAVLFNYYDSYFEVCRADNL
jgi:hypothetical protein